jgi:hypothetical protein
VGSFVSRNVNDLQWVGRFGNEDPTYLFGHMNQTTVGITGRLDYAFTPTLSLQLYAQPFVSAAEYSDFKRMADPGASTYDQRMAAVPTTVTDVEVHGDVDGDGIVDSFGRPDFNFKQFRSNAVLRWEYRPGSTLFLVWAQGRDQYLPYDGSFQLRQNLDGLFHRQADDIFMVKLSYWINP